VITIIHDQDPHGKFDETDPNFHMVLKNHIAKRWIDFSLETPCIVEEIIDPLAVVVFLILALVIVVISMKDGIIHFMEPSTPLVDTGDINLDGKLAQKNITSVTWHPLVLNMAMEITHRDST